MTLYERKIRLRLQLNLLRAQKYIYLQTFRVSYIVIHVVAINSLIHTGWRVVAMGLFIYYNVSVLLVHINEVVFYYFDLNSFFELFISGYKNNWVVLGESNFYDCIRHFPRYWVFSHLPCNMSTCWIMGFDKPHSRNGRFLIIFCYGGTL